jgi:hypothetical protein
MAYLTETELQQIARNNNIPSTAVRVENPQTNDVFWIQPDKTDAISAVRNGQLNATTVYTAGYTGIYLMTSRLKPDVQQPPVTNPAPTPLPPTVVDLLQVIEVTPTVIAREYTKSTLRPVQAQEIRIRNKSDKVSIKVSIRSTGPVSYSPSTVDIGKGEIKSVTVSFDPMKLDTLGEGLNTITTIFDVSSPDGVIFTPTTPVQNVPQPPPAQQESSYITTRRIDMVPETKTIGYITYQIPVWKIERIRVFDTGRVEIIDYTIHKGERRIILDETPILINPPPYTPPIGPIVEQLPIEQPVLLPTVTLPTPPAPVVIGPSIPGGENFGQIEDDGDIIQENRRPRSLEQ